MKRSKLMLIALGWMLLSLACSGTTINNFLTMGAIPPTPVAELAQGGEPSPTQEATQAPLPGETPAISPEAPIGRMNSRDVIILEDNRFKVKERDYIVGLVQNNSNTSIKWVKITINLYDETNQIIDTEIAYPFLNLIPAGTSSPFSTFSENWETAVRYEFQVEWTPTDELPAVGLEFGSYTSTTNEFNMSIVGEVRNQSARPIGWVKIASSLYAEDGTLLNTSFSYAMLKYILPGGVSPFKIWFSDNLESVSRYEIQVQGSYDELLPEFGVEVVTSRLTEDEGRCVIDGTVKNNEADPISYATVVVAFYDSNDNLIDAVWGMSDSSVITAGGLDTYEVVALTCPAFNHFEVYASE